MIDPLTSAALSIHSSPKVYALLLGSGVSRGAAILTGWEITLDLIRKLASPQGQHIEGDLAEWYRQQYGGEPDYSHLLEVVKSQSGRRDLLRVYFKQREEDHVAGRAVSEAHMAIARLVRDGWIRVIITTNFDRMIETSLEKLGIVPDVVIGADQIAHARHWAHSECYLLKLHGDHMDARIKNTEKELAQYDPAMDSLLDSILAAHGLIICGWSATWDAALRRAISRCDTRGHTTYWTYRGTPERINEDSRRLIDQRDAVTIQIQDADTFFGDLENRVLAIDRAEGIHRADPQTAAAMVKNAIEAGTRIRLHDLVVDEARRVRKASAEMSLPDASPMDIMSRLEALSQTCATMLATGCWWGEDAYADVWRSAIECLSPNQVQTTLDSHIRLLHYPALICLYAGGIAAISSGKYVALRAMLIDAKIPHSQRSEMVSAVLYLSKDYAVWYGWSADGNSAQVFRVLKPVFGRMLPSDAAYRSAFAQFEYLVALTYADEVVELQRYPYDPDGYYFFLGSVRTRLSQFPRWGREDCLARDTIESVHPELLDAGFFGGSVERYERACVIVDGEGDPLRAKSNSQR
jgi:hypothetical protein